MTPTDISAARRRAAHISWAYTAHRGERTAPARQASPGSREYWTEWARAQGVREEDVPAAAASAHRAYMAELARRAAIARRERRVS